MGDRGWRGTGELGTVGSLVGGLSALGRRPALVAFGEEGVESLVVWRACRAGAASCAWSARGWGGARGPRGDPCGNRPEWVAACLAVISAGAWSCRWTSRSGMRPLVTFW